jgi:cytochrome b561
MPLSGWALTSASKQIQIYPIVLYGLVHWPAIGPLTTLAPAKMKAAHHLFTTTHVLLSYMAYGLLALHVGAALRHQFIKRDVVLSRMLPFVRRPA